MAKSVRVHEDTHAALKRLKAHRRAASLDQVIREAIKDAMEGGPEEGALKRKSEQLTSYAEG
ncbi:MAG: hypothetical protein ACHQYR_01175 [Candidatus Gagatemarchaeaceae archaeon]